MPITLEFSQQETATVLLALGKLYHRAHNGNPNIRASCLSAAMKITRLSEKNTLSVLEKAK